MIVEEAIGEVRRLTGGNRSTRNRLTSAVADSDDSLTFDFAIGGVQPGARLDVGGETLYVWESDAGSKTATVKRGDEYTTASSHAAGAEVLVAPRFTGAEIRKALQFDVLRLPSEGLYRMKRIEVPFDWLNYAFDLTSLGDHISLYRMEVESGGRTYFLNGFHRSGDLLHPHHGLVPDTDVGWVHVRTTFDPFVNDDDDFETVCGIPSSAHDLLPLGAAYRLLAGEEGRRVNQGVQSPRKGEDVPPGAPSQATGQLKVHRDLRLAQEVLKLRKKHPIRIQG